jgi:hypothetical protein
MWEKMATCIWKVAAEVLGVIKGSGCNSKTLGGGMKMCKRLSRKRRNATSVCTRTGVQTT